MTAPRGARPIAQSCRKCGTGANLCTDNSNASGKRSICRPCMAEESKSKRQENRRASGSTAGPRSNSPTLEPLTDVQLAHQLRALLAKKRPTPWALDELSDQFDVGLSRIKRALDSLSEQHVNITQSDGGLWIASEIPAEEPTVIPLQSLRGKVHRFAVTGDNHLGSRYARLDCLNALYDLWADMGITTVYQCGNMIDGEARFNKSDLLAFGIEGQTDYFIDNWPQRKGITTYYITGDDHEGWYVQREHINIGRFMAERAKAAGRDDLVYLGHMEHDLVFQAEHGHATCRLIHAGGGTAYALSYTLQQIINSYSGGEKPNLLCAGHYHKFDANYWREVFNVQVGATQQQTPWMRKKKIQSQLGGVTIEFEQSKDGLLHNIKVGWTPFYNREFYLDEQWKYHWRDGEPTRKRRAA